MKNLNNLFLIVIIPLLTVSVNAQSVDEIIENYFENTGSAKSWAEVESVKMNMSVNQMGMEIPIGQYQSSDRKYTKISIQGMEIKQGVFDGETLWSTDLMSMKAVKSDQ